MYVCMYVHIDTCAHICAPAYHARAHTLEHKAVQHPLAANSRYTEICANVSLKADYLCGLVVRVPGC
jgi:hypothetical protein